MASSLKYLAVDKRDLACIVACLRCPLRCTPSMWRPTRKGLNKKQKKILHDECQWVKVRLLGQYQNIEVRVHFFLCRWYASHDDDVMVHISGVSIISVVCISGAMRRRRCVDTYTQTSDGEKRDVCWHKINYQKYRSAMLHFISFYADDMFLTTMMWWLRCVVVDVSTHTYRRVPVRKGTFAGTK